MKMIVWYLRRNLHENETSNNIIAMDFIVLKEVLLNGLMVEIKISIGLIYDSSKFAI